MSSGSNAPLRVGVIGVGAMGRHHARILSTMPGAELVGLHNQDAGRGAEIAAAAGTRSYDSLDALLAERPDAVIVAVPTRAHAEVALACLERGCAVLVEKPIAASLDEARAMIAAARRRRLALGVGHVERFNPAMLALKSALGADPVLAIQAVRVSPFPARLSDVGVILDLGVHDIDLVRWVAGSDVSLVGVSAARIAGERDDLAMIQLRAASGCLAQIHLNWHSPVRVRRFEATTAGALLVADLIARTVTRYTAGADGNSVAEAVEVGGADPLGSEIADFLDAVRAGREPAITGEAGMAALETALACLDRVEAGWSRREPRPGARLAQG